MAGAIVNDHRPVPEHDDNGNTAPVFKGTDGSGNLRSSNEAANLFSVFCVLCGKIVKLTQTDSGTHCIFEQT